MKKYLEDEFENEELLFCLNIIFIILIVPFFIIYLNKCEITNNFLKIFIMLIGATFFTYVSFEIKYRIIIFMNKKRNIRKNIKNLWFILLIKFKKRKVIKAFLFLYIKHSTTYLLIW